VGLLSTFLPSRTKKAKKELSCHPYLLPLPLEANYHLHCPRKQVKPIFVALLFALASFWHDLAKLGGLWPPLASHHWPAAATVLPSYGLLRPVGGGRLGRA